MSRITPIIGTYGTFELKAPWVVNPGEHYTITAIQTLDEIVRGGVDPKTAIYAPMGLGSDNGNFNWSDEFKSNPSIITLAGTRGGIIVVPDTFISSYPNQAAIEYSNFVVSINLGMFPSTENFTQLKEDLRDLAYAYTKQINTGEVYKLPVETQPTESQHQSLLRIRKLERTDSMTNAEELSRLRNENQKLKISNAALIKRLQDLGELTI